MSWVNLCRKTLEITVMPCIAIIFLFFFCHFKCDSNDSFFFEFLISESDQKNEQMHHIRGSGLYISHMSFKIWDVEWNTFQFIGDLNIFVLPIRIRWVRKALSISEQLFYLFIFFLLSTRLNRAECVNDLNLKEKCSVQFCAWMHSSGNGKMFYVLCANEQNN